MSKYRLMQGNEACVMGALYAGMNFYSGYPITPSTEIAELSAKFLPYKGGKFIQMEDEIAGIAAAIGASIAGSKSMTATSGPGFSLKQENFGYAVISEIPMVVVNVMRGGPSTGLPTQSSQGDIYQAKYGSHGDVPVIVLAPKSVPELFTYTIRAFNLSEKYLTPVTILSDEVIGHMRERVLVPEPGEIEIINRLKPREDVEFKAYKVEEGDIVPRRPAYGDGYRFHVTGLFHDETGFPSNSAENADYMLKRLHSKINDHKDDICDYEMIDCDDAEVIFVSYGSTSRSARQAVIELREEGLKVGLFRPITLWPSPDVMIKKMGEIAKHIIVAEMNLGQYVLEVERIVKSDAKVHHIGRANGVILTPEELKEMAKELISGE